jgi:hypothetical protein
MKGNFIFTFFLITLLTLTKPSFCQTRTPVSAEDKAAIIELFKGVPKSQYRLQFNNSKEVYGSKKVSMTELTQLSKVRKPGMDNGYVVLIVQDDGVMYVLAATKGGKLESVLGAEKFAKLNKITAKYAR